MNKAVKTFALLTALLTIYGCASLGHKDRLPLNQSAHYYNYIQPTFADYLKKTETWLKSNRSFITEDHQHEITMNMPFELSPEYPTDKAILLVHGLGDSPFSFSDLAVSLRNQGFYVQTLLLAGHGSKPTDLQKVHYTDWQSQVDHYAKLLKDKYHSVWLGGFSTGANLVTINALEQGDVDGLILLSPGFQSKVPILERLAPLAALFTDGFSTEEHNIARYTSAPLQGAIAYTDSALRLRKLLEETDSVTIPSLFVMSEADSVVDADAIETIYTNHFIHPRNQLIWYGESKPNTSSVTTHSMKLAAQQISTGSHMSPLFAPSNHYYGVQGKHRMCMNSLDDAATQRCKNGEDVWFAAWGVEEDGKIHARLTWNPYYLELENSIKNMVRNTLISRQ